MAGLKLTRLWQNYICKTNNTSTGGTWSCLRSKVTITLFHSHYFTTLKTFTLSQHAEQLLFSFLCSKVTLSLFHFHYFQNFQSLICSLSLDMLNNFCYHVYAQKWFPAKNVWKSDKRVIVENGNGYFLTSPSSSTPCPVSLEFIELVPS